MGMEDIALTWNLVILSAFVMLFAYSFLLGQDSTIKLILSIYIAILTADGLAGVLQQFVFEPSPGFQELLEGQEGSFFVWMRIILFITAVVLFTVKSGFHVLIDKHEKWSIRFLIHMVFAAMSALLFLSTILIYLSGNSFVEGMMFAKDIVIYEQSLLAQILIDYYQIWFSLPAIAFLVSSFFFEKERKDPFA